MALGAESDIYSSIGTVLHVSASVPATYDAAGFAALTFTEVGLVGSLSEFGGTTGVDTFEILKSGNTVKRKGFTDYGTLDVGMARVTADDGQTLLKSGFDGANAGDVYSVKLVHPTATGLTQYFTCIVTSYTTNPEAIVQASVALELDNKVVDVTA